MRGRALTGVAMAVLLVAVSLPLIEGWPIGAADRDHADSATVESDERWPCSGFAADRSLPGIPLSWTYRLCGHGTARRRIDLLFRNVGERPAGILFVAFLNRPTNCSDPQPVGGGHASVNPGQSSPLTGFEVMFSEYRGELWLCVAGPDVLARIQPTRSSHGPPL